MAESAPVAKADCSPDAGYPTAFRGGRVAASRSASSVRASAGDRPHMSPDGCSRRHTAGLSARPKRPQRLSQESWTQRTPAGFPSGMPGMEEEIEGAMQHAPQPILHFIGLP